jgi:tRNA-2-methylthio-N6-dimethylallyladenosine synthase
MAEHLRDEVAARAPHVSLLAGPDTYRDIASLVDRARAGERVVALKLDRAEVYEGLDARLEDDGVSGLVTVQRGCDKFCSFCVVPYTRGRERGVPPREVLRQVSRLVEAGAREVTLLGQTVSSYRWEDADFADLLRAGAATPGIARVRFTSPHPADFTDRLVDAIAEGGPICPQVHLPVQSGSDRVLSAMKRGYDRSSYLAVVDHLRARVPDLALSTDLMVGFCGETEADQESTLSLMRDVRFDAAFMFAYSDRGITHAARHLADDVPAEVKARRLQEVIDLQEIHTRASHEARIGREEQVLVTGLSRRRDRLVGRTRRFQRVLLPPGSAERGELVRRRIRGSTGHSLIAD